MVDYLNIINYQFLRFIFVGVINSIFGYGCFALFLYAGLHYTLAVLVATIIGVLFNFKSTGVLVFGSHDNRLIWRFVGTYVLIYSINVTGIKAFSYFGVIPYISGAILIIPMAILAFLLNKRFVF